MTMETSIHARVIFDVRSQLMELISMVIETIKSAPAAVLLKPGLEVDAYEKKSDKRGLKGKIKTWCLTCKIPIYLGDEHPGYEKNAIHL